MMQVHKYSRTHTKRSEKIQSTSIHSVLIPSGHLALSMPLTLYMLIVGNVTRTAKYTMVA